MTHPNKQQFEHSYFLYKMSKGKNAHRYTTRESTFKTLQNGKYSLYETQFAYEMWRMGNECVK